MADNPFPPDLPVPATYSEALRGLVNKARLQSQMWAQQQYRANRVGAHPDLLEFERVFIKRMSKLGVPLFAAEVVRSSQRQEELFALGNSRAKGGQSAHQYGCAVDIVHSIRGWNLAPKEWAVIGHVGKELIVSKGFAMTSNAWGGDWSFWDPAHWQIADWRNQVTDYPWPKLDAWRPNWRKSIE